MMKKVLLPTILLVLAYGFWVSPDFKEIAAGVAIFLFGMLALEEGFKAFTGGGLETEELRTQRDQHQRGRRPGKGNLRQFVRFLSGAGRFGFPPRQSAGEKSHETAQAGGKQKGLDLAEELDLVTSASAVAASLGNIGPGLGSVGPTDNFAHVPAFGKLVLAFCMLLGRLELFTVLVLVFPSFWRK
mgnify:CR=1 FL=1